MVRAASPRARRVAVLACLVVATQVGVAVWASAPASGTLPPLFRPLQLTVVARACPAYTDVTANRFRNIQQESFEDLGGRTLYGAGQPISVATETTGQPDPPCTPLPGWTFTLGSGTTNGNPNHLSTVTGANGSVTTLASTPELDEDGNPTGQSLAGAATITLTPAQAALADRAGGLWIQGGTPADPLNGRAQEFAFAVLRCAIDNVHGDNVE